MADQEQVSTLCKSITIVVLLDEVVIRIILVDNSEEGFHIYLISEDDWD